MQNFRKLFLLLPLTVLLFFADVASAEEEGPNPLSPVLVSEVTAIRPGEPFYVGLWLEHPEHYHSYWKAPGIVGIPTGLDWKLPEGFEAGEIEWPVPVRVSMAGINAHGYYGKTLLMVKVTPPAEIADDRIELRAGASWMCCAKTCHPGFQDVAITLPVDRESKETLWDEKWRPVFESTREKFPEPLVGWSVVAKESGKEVRFEIRITGVRGVMPNLDASSIYFFCGDGQINSESPQKVTKANGSLTLTMVRSQFGPKEALTFPGLLYCEEGWLDGGKQRYGSVQVPRPKPE